LLGLALIISLMKAFFRHFASAADETFYMVNKDGALVLDRDALLQSGKMTRQLDAARDLKKRSVRRARLLNEIASVSREK
jgi:hypothetical protein